MPTEEMLRFVEAVVYAETGELLDLSRPKIPADVVIKDNPLLQLISRYSLTPDAKELESADGC